MRPPTRPPSLLLACLPASPKMKHRLPPKLVSFVPLNHHSALPFPSRPTCGDLLGSSTPPCSSLPFSPALALCSCAPPMPPPILPSAHSWVTFGFSNAARYLVDYPQVGGRTGDAARCRWGGALAHCFLFQMGEKEGGGGSRVRYRGGQYCLMPPDGAGGGPRQYGTDGGEYRSPLE